MVINPHDDASSDFDLMPRPVKQELSYFVLETLLMRNKSRMLHSLSVAQLKYMSEGMSYQLVHWNDILMNSRKAQQFILIIKSGRMVVCNLDDEVTEELDFGTVYFETSCFLGSPCTFDIRCYGENVEK